LSCPTILLGQGRAVASPSEGTVEEYRRYYNERASKLRGGGAFRFDPHVDRTIHLVTPRWDDALDRQFAKDLQASLCDVTGLAFRLHNVHADTPEEAIERLHQVQPGTAVIVFDPCSTDQAAYSLLSYELRQWTIKRLLRHRVENRWASIQRATRQKDKIRAERNWQSAIELSALDVLDQMGTTLWRLDGFGYDACLAIDVGQDRRHFALSLLICRDPSVPTSFLRIARWWHKADHQRESINSEVLAGSIGDLLSQCQNRPMAPLASVLVLRDGHQRGMEPEGIAKGLDRWRKAGLLQQGAHVDVVDVQKHSLRGVRLWAPDSDGARNVLEGTAVYISSRVAYICCTGAACLSEDVTADPSVLICQEGTDIQRVSRAYASLAQLNYSTPSKAHRLAQPLREVDAILEDCQRRNMRGIR
jgi:hypothetical protein